MHCMAKTRELALATLGGVCADLGAELLDVVLAPRGLDVPVRDVVVLDPLDTPGTGISAGDLVLAVGLAGNDDTTREAIRAAGVAGAAAIVCKRRGAVPSCTLAAEDADVALLSTAADAPWAELFELLRAALAVDHASELPSIPGTTMGDLLSLADATAAMAGGPVTIEDMHGRVLAFSQDGQTADPQRVETVLGRRVPDQMMRELRRMGVLDRLMETDEVVPVRLPDSAPRRAIAIRAGANVLGAIWLVGNGDLSANADVALREAAQIAALHVMRHRVLDDLERRVRGSMVGMLLKGEGRPEPMLERLGLAADGDVVVVAVEPEGAAAPQQLDRLLDLALVHLHAYRWHAAATTRERRLHLLVALKHDGASEDPHEALRRTIQDWLTRACKTVGVDLRAGMGEALAARGGVVDAGRGADRALELGAEPNRVVTLEEVHGAALLAEVGDFLRGHCMAQSNELRALLDYDREHATDFIPTLRVFLEVQSDAGRAATRLGVHVNTLRYRVRRIVTLTGADLADPDARLALEVQLRALPVRPGSSARA